MPDLFNDKTTVLVGFTDFWQAYPRKVAKAAAEKAYRKAVSHGVSHATLMEGVARLRISVMGKEESFIPHAASWLNGRRWEDGVRSMDGAVLEKVSRSASAGVENDWRYRLGLVGNGKLYAPGRWWSSAWGTRPEHGGSDIPPTVLKEWEARTK
jgi:hypothetical protein